MNPCFYPMWDESFRRGPRRMFVGRSRAGKGKSDETNPIFRDRCWRICGRRVSGKRTVPQGESKQIKPNRGEKHRRRGARARLGHEVGEFRGAGFAAAESNLIKANQTSFSHRTCLKRCQRITRITRMARSLHSCDSLANRRFPGLVAEQAQAFCCLMD